MGEAKQRQRHQHQHLQTARDWWRSQGLRLGEVRGIENWTGWDPHSDWITYFGTASGGTLLFHFTPTVNAEVIERDGFEDHTCHIGFDGRPSAHAVYFGTVPPIMSSIDSFHPGAGHRPGDITWFLVEAPAGMWPAQALSHHQDSAWPLYQVCYKAALCNTWPRRRVPVEDVLAYRPGLLAHPDGVKWIEEAVRNEWLDPKILARFTTETSEASYI